VQEIGEHRARLEHLLLYTLETVSALRALLAFHEARAPVPAAPLTVLCRTQGKVFIGCVVEISASALAEVK
jgi:hypothetical protein